MVENSKAIVDCSACKLFPHGCPKDHIACFQPKPDDVGLLTDEGGKDTERAVADLEQAGLSSLFSYRHAYFAGAKAQQGRTRKECRDKAQLLITDYTKYIEARKFDLSDMPPLSVSHGVSLRARRDALDFALKLFLHLANK